MTPCRHHPTFHIKQLFSRTPKYTCRECGADLKMSPTLRTIMQAMNALFIIGILFAAFRGTGKDSGVNGFLIYLAVMVGVLLIYLLLQFLLIRFGPFVENIVEEPAEPIADPNSLDGVPDEADSSVASLQNPNLTDEQREIIALYQAYAAKDREENPTAATSENSVEEEIEPIPAEPEIPCEHSPAVNFRNYMPGTFEFTCEHCGKRITFAPETKKRLNMILMVFSLLVLMGSFSIPNVDLLQLILMAVGVLAVCTGIQLIYLKRSKFVLADVPATNRR